MLCRLYRPTTNSQGTSSAWQMKYWPIIERRNLGLLDFLDFYDSYKQNVLQVNSIKYNRIQAFEDLNFYTGTNLFN